MKYLKTSVVFFMFSVVGCNTPATTPVQETLERPVGHTHAHSHGGKEHTHFHYHDSGLGNKTDSTQQHKPEHKHGH